MFANLLIGLREGLEAALIVSILLATVTRTGRRELRGSIWLGVVAAVSASIATGALLQFTRNELPDRAEAAFSGVMSVVAVGLVTWMVFWMASRARFLRAHLESGVERALAGGRWALGLMAFVAVIREGLETTLFLWSGAVSTGDGAVGAPLAGALLGLLAAAALGVLLYRGALTLDLASLFRWSALALIVIAAGVLSYAAGEFAEIGWLPGEHNLVFDVSSTIAPDSVVAELLRGLLNFRPQTSLPVFVAWLGYLVPVLVLFLQRLRPTNAQSK